MSWLRERLARTMLGRLLLVLSPLLAIVLVVALFRGIEQAQIAAHRPKGPEIEFSDSVEELHLVYFDVYKVEPSHSVSLQFSDGNIASPQKIICRCTTTDGQQVWLSIDTADYLKSIDPSAKFGSPYYSPKAAFFRNERIHGYIRKANDVSDGLRYDIQSETVVEFISIGSSAS